MKKHLRLLKNLAGGIAALMLGVTNVEADSIARGQRGPTEWQADLRLGFAERENTTGVTTKSIVSQNVLKYWNGGSIGMWGYASMPYRALDNGKTESSGVGDMTLGLGPRFTRTNSIGSFHFLPYVALTLPTGDSSARPALGNDRLDLKLGTGFTYLTRDKKGEIGGHSNIPIRGLGLHAILLTKCMGACWWAED